MITELENSLEGLNSNFDQAKERISKFIDTILKLLWQSRKKRMMKKNEESLGDLWNTIKQKNICIIGVPEGEERRAENLRNSGS